MVCYGNERAKRQGEMIESVLDKNILHSAVFKVRTAAVRAAGCKNILQNVKLSMRSRGKAGGGRLPVDGGLNFNAVFFYFRLEGRA